MPLVLTIRPEPGLSATIASGREAGLDITGEPLFAIRPVSWEAPSAEVFDALLIGSANAIRHGGAALGSFSEVPVHAVGKTTAETARAAGFEVAKTGGGGLQQLLDKTDEPLCYLRLAGRSHVTLTPRKGKRIVTRIVYESAPLPMPSSLANLLRESALVMLHSADAARHFASECDRLGIVRSRISLAALGPRIAAAAGTGWHDVGSAQSPNDAALLALTRDMRA